MCTLQQERELKRDLTVKKNSMEESDQVLDRRPHFPRKWRKPRLVNVKLPLHSLTFQFSTCETA